MKYEIKIPTSCNENWNKMTPTEKGAFCKRCEKEVLDFTNLSDYQLVQLLESNTKLCGKFKPEQLNKEIASVKNNYYPQLGALLGVSALLAIAAPVYAQNNVTNTIKIEQQKEINNTTVKSKVLKDSIQVSGQVFYEEVPLEGVNIIVKGSNYGTQTDANGNFSLKIHKEQNGKYPVLEIFYIGFESQQIKVKHSTGFQKIQMKEDMVVLGMVIVKKRNIFNRIGNLFKKKNKTTHH